MRRCSAGSIETNEARRRSATPPRKHTAVFWLFNAHFVDVRRDNAIGRRVTELGDAFNNALAGHGTQSTGQNQIESL